MFKANALVAEPGSISNVHPFAHPLDRFRAGELTRRQLLSGAAMLGVSAGAASVLANPGRVLGQASPAAGTPASATPVTGTPAADLAAGLVARPAAGTESQTRGQGGELRIIWWQAPSLLEPHANGDASASSFVLEPLLNYFPGDGLGPVLLPDYDRSIGVDTMKNSCRTNYAASPASSTSPSRRPRRRTLVLGSPSTRIAPRPMASGSDSRPLATA